MTGLLQTGQVKLHATSKMVRVRRGINEYKRRDKTKTRHERNMKSGSDNNIVTHSHSSDVGGRGAGGAETQRTHGKREGRGAGGAETQRTHGRREKAKNTKSSLLFDKNLNFCVNNSNVY